MEIDFLFYFRCACDAPSRFPTRSWPLIAVTSCLVYVNEGVCTPIAEEWRPTSPQAPKKRPPLIHLKKKFGAKVVSKKAAHPVAKEEAEEAEGEEEALGCDRERPLSKEGVFSELGLVVVSDHSDESSSEERVGASVSQGPIAGRTDAVAAAEASNTIAAEQTVAAGEAVTAQGSTSSGANEAVRAVEVLKGATVPTPPVEAAVEIPMQTAAAGSHEAEQTAKTDEGGPWGFSAVVGGQESTAAAGATDMVREEVPSTGQTNAADEGRAGSEEDHLPLTQSLKAKALLQTSASLLEAALERLQEGPSRGLPPCPGASHLEVLAQCQGPGDAPECSEEVYQEQCVDEDESADVEALVDSVAHSLKVLKRLALWAQNHQQMWDAEFTFCKELQAEHQSTEAELKEEVKNLHETLRTSELNLAIAWAKKEALANVLSEAKACGVAKYKAGPSFKEDLEQYGALCYKVGLGVGEDRG
ncbi:hypothetical protein Taro_035352 [Colocasia esculenta]|uniref:Uncharacterized protein n=1 Tax=Colocasia esculenta TaxID=4460 RepID=A0A843WCZ1_COLES|nr:hypothetical protein [Colocasia esculenta]